MVKKKKTNGKSKGKRGDDRQKRRGESARGEREGEIVFFSFSSLLSKIYGNQTVGFFRSKRQSWSTHREIYVGTKILEFHQTLRGREFSYLGYFEPKGHLMAWDLLRGHERP